METRISRYSRDYIPQRDSGRLCGPYTARLYTWNEAPPKVFVIRSFRLLFSLILSLFVRFGCLNSCQEVVLHVSHLMGLLDSGWRRGVLVRQLTRDRALFLVLSLRRRLGYSLP